MILKKRLKLFLIALILFVPFLVKAEATCKMLIWNGYPIEGHRTAANSALLTVETAYDNTNTPVGILLKVESAGTYDTYFTYDQAQQLREWADPGNNSKVISVRSKTNAPLISEMILPFGFATNTNYYIGADGKVNTTSGTGPFRIEQESGATYSNGTTVGSTYTFKGTFAISVNGTNVQMAGIPISLTIGETCVTDTNPPVINSATFVGGGTQGVKVNLNTTDDVNLSHYVLRAYDDSWETESVAISGTSHSGEVTFILPNGHSLSASDQTFKIYAYDAKGNVSASKQISAKITTTGPTMGTASCYSATDSQLVINVSSTPGTGGNVVKYNLTGSLSRTVEVDGSGRITVDGLQPNKNYNFIVKAVDEMGNMSSTLTVVSCMTTDYINPYCGRLLSVRQSELNSRDQLNSKALVWMSKTGGNEMTILITNYPGTAPLNGFRIEVPDARLGGGQIEFQLNASGSAAMGTVVGTSNFGSGSYSGTPVTISLDGGVTTQSAYKLTFTGDFSQMTNPSKFFMIRWWKWYNNSNRQYDLHAEDRMMYPISLDDMRNCDLDDLLHLDPVYWDDGNGSPFELDLPSDLNNNPVNTTAIAGGCGDMIFGTRFSSSTTSNHNTIEDITNYDLVNMFD